MRELPPAAAHLPDAVVGLAPDGLEMLDERAFEIPAVLCRRQSGAARDVEGVHDLAEHVELQLLHCGVAEPDRFRSHVARQPRRLDFVEPPLARDAVHRLHVVGSARDRAVQPLAPGFRLLEVARADERKQGEGRVAQPAKTIVPVALAAEAFRQRRRSRRDDAARLPVRKRLERKERPQDRLVPFATRGEGSRPAGPEACDLIQSLARVKAGRRLAKGGRPGQ